MLARALFLATSALVVSPAMASDTWVVDPSTQCKVQDLGWIKNTTVKWDGSCKSGFADGTGKLVFADGTGKLEWSSEGIKYFTARARVVDQPLGQRARQHELALGHEYMLKQRILQHERERKQRLEREERRKRIWLSVLEGFGIEEAIQISPRILQKNPFKYEGKVVVVRAVLRQMRSRSMGVFADEKSLFEVTGQYIVSGIPDDISIPDNVFFMFGKVLGNVEIPTGTGRILLPHLQFVGIHRSVD